MEQEKLDRALGAQRLILRELSRGRDAGPVSRFSRLYSLYNGFMLGQFLIGSALEFTRQNPGKVAEEVFRVNEFLEEIGVEERLSDDPPGFGTPEFQHVILGQIIPGVAAASIDVAEFTLLSVQLIFYGHSVHFEPDSIDLYRTEIERLRTKHELPEIDFDALIPPLYQDREPPILIDDVLNAALRYLEFAVDSIDVEPDTAFVIMRSLSRTRTTSTVCIAPLSNWLASEPSERGVGYQTKNTATCCSPLLRRSGSSGLTFPA